MTRKDYREIARVLRLVRKYQFHPNFLEDHPEFEQPYLAGCGTTLDRIVNNLVIVLSAANPQFSATKFRDAIYN